MAGSHTLYFLCEFMEDDASAEQMINEDVRARTKGLPIHGGLAGPDTCPLACITIA